MGMRLFILSFVTCLPVPYFFHNVSKMARIFEKKILIIIYAFSDSLYNFYLKKLSFLEEISLILSLMYIILNVTY